MTTLLGNSLVSSGGIIVPDEIRKIEFDTRDWTISAIGNSKYVFTSGDHHYRATYGSNFVVPNGFYGVILSPLAIELLVPYRMESDNATVNKFDYRYHLGGQDLTGFLSNDDNDFFITSASYSDATRGDYAITKTVTTQLLNGYVFSPGDVISIADLRYITRWTQLQTASNLQTGVKVTIEGTTSSTSGSSGNGPVQANDYAEYTKVSYLTVNNEELAVIGEGKLYIGKSAVWTNSSANDVSLVEGLDKLTFYMGLYPVPTT